MFDPTAFDNMKVVIEGLLYDKDLNGDYEVIDRNDIINLSKMDRKFSMQYKKHHYKHCSCNFILSTTAKDLYFELLNADADVGCFVTFEFHFSKEIKLDILNRSLILLKNNTNQPFDVFQNIKQSIFDKNTIETTMIVNFTNKITEEDFEELEEMIHISEIMLQWYDEQI